MKAARAAIDKAGGDVLLTGRAECFLVGRPDLDETVRRLKAYSAAGADCLYAPGIRTPELIAAVVKAAAPKPVNVLMPGALGLTVADLEALGARRISVGGTLARVAWARSSARRRRSRATAASTRSRMPPRTPRSMASSATT